MYIPSRNLTERIYREHIKINGNHDTNYTKLEDKLIDETREFLAKKITKLNGSYIHIQSSIKPDETRTLYIKDNEFVPDYKRLLIERLSFNESNDMTTLDSIAQEINDWVKNNPEYKFTGLNKNSPEYWRYEIINNQVFLNYTGAINEEKKQAQNRANTITHRAKIIAPGRKF